MHLLLLQEVVFDEDEVQLRVLKAGDYLFQCGVHLRADSNLFEAYQGKARGFHALILLVLLSLFDDFLELLLDAFQGRVLVPRFVKLYIDDVSVEDPRIDPEGVLD